VAADPAEGGNVWGGGTFTYLEEAGVHAEPATGWNFNHWLADGSIVSYDTAYTIIVNRDLDLTASFSMKEVLNVSISHEGPDEICQGDTVFLQALATGGDPPYSFSWSSDPPGVSGSSDEIMDQPMQATKYYVRVSDLNATEKTDSVSIDVLSSPPANIVGKGNPPYMLICIDSGYTYQWFMNGNALIGEVKQFYYPGEQGLEAGEYYALVTNDNGCRAKSNEFVQGTKSDFFIYPNPNEGTFNVSIHLAGSLITGELLISDMTGNRISRVTVMGRQGTYHLNLIPKGVFIAELRTGGQRIIKKLIVY